jgi:hypothetical protein
MQSQAHWSTLVSGGQDARLKKHPVHVMAAERKRRMVLITAVCVGLNPRRRVYVEIPKPSRVVLKLRQNPWLTPRGGFDYSLALPSRVLITSKPSANASGFDYILAKGFISILKCLKAKSYVLSLPGRVLVELPRPSALRKRLMHFSFEIIIWDTKVF